MLANGTISAARASDREFARFDRDDTEALDSGTFGSGVDGHSRRPPNARSGAGAPWPPEGGCPLAGRPPPLRLPQLCRRLAELRRVLWLPECRASARVQGDVETTGRTAWEDIPRFKIPRPVPPRKVDDKVQL